MKKTFDEVFVDRTKYGTKIKTDEYHEQGEHLIIDQGQADIAGYTDLEEGLFTEVPVVIFGDHTRVIKYVDKPFFLGADGTKVLRSKIADANYRYLYYALKNAKIPNTGYNRHFKWLKEVEIEYPEVGRQAEIVDILDRIAGIIDARRIELQKLDELVKSRFIEMFGDNKVTTRVTMSDITSIITDGTHQPPKFRSSGIPFIFVSNITTNELTYEAEKFIDQETYDELYKRTPIEIGDLLLSTVGSYGHPAIVKKNDKFLFQRHIAYLKPIKEKVNSVYLHGAILTDDVQRQIDKVVKGIAQKTLNLSEIKKLVIPLPPLDLQNQFAAFVQQVDKSKFVIKQSIEKLELLKSKLMQDYFG